MSWTILLVEDDPDTAACISHALCREGLTVEHLSDNQKALSAASRRAYDAIILDRIMPGLDGLSIVLALRAAGIATPVVTISALSGVKERVEGLRAGSDDYLAKPFHYAELAARLESLLRYRGHRPLLTELSCGNLRMDLLSRKASRDGHAIKLLPREFKLLNFLFLHRECVVTRTMLLDEVWDYRCGHRAGAIDTCVSRLRNKLDNGYSKPILHTVRGMGYRLSEEP